MQKNSRTLVFLIIGIIIFGGVVVAERITFRGNDVDQHSGELKDVSSIILFDQPLIIKDEVSGAVKAVFNAELPIITTMAVDIPFNISNTTTSFLGDVNNFDNINGFSRFKETNVNNGSFAAAGFTAENDAGITITFGIGSSQFEVGGEELFSTPAIQSFAPAPFRFVNRLDVGYLWRSNTNNDSTNSSSIINSMILDEKGNLEIAGNYTGINAHIDNEITANNATLNDTVHANLAKIETFVILGQTFIDSISGTIPCDISTEGGIGYSSIDQEFYGCRDKSGGSQNDFEWKKLT